MSVTRQAKARSEANWRDRVYLYLHFKKATVEMTIFQRPQPGRCRSAYQFDAIGVVLAGATSRNVKDFWTTCQTSSMSGRACARPSFIGYNAK